MSTSIRFRQTVDMIRAAGLQLSQEEESFLNAAANSSTSWSQSTSTLYSSKLLERSNKGLAEANDRQAKTMTKLTWALVIFTAVQAFATVVYAYEALAN